MLEIQPVLATFSVVKPKKIKRDDNLPKRQQRGNKQEAEKHDTKPMQHIDEIV
jgi:hypothetical protein